MACIPLQGRGRRFEPVNAHHQLVSLLVVRALGSESGVLGDRRHSGCRSSSPRKRSTVECVNARSGKTERHPFSPSGGLAFTAIAVSPSCRARRAWARLLCSTDSAPSTRSENLTGPSCRRPSGLVTLSASRISSAQVPDGLGRRESEGSGGSGLCLLVILGADQVFDAGYRRGRDRELMDP
jgi:hypothetical protein